MGQVILHQLLSNKFHLPLSVTKIGFWFLSKAANTNECLCHDERGSHFISVHWKRAQEKSYSSDDAFCCKLRCRITLIFIHHARTRHHHEVVSSFAWETCLLHRLLPQIVFWLKSLSKLRTQGKMTRFIFLENQRLLLVSKLSVSFTTLCVSTNSTTEIVQA